MKPNVMEDQYLVFKTKIYLPVLLIFFLCFSCDYRVEKDSEQDSADLVSGEASGLNGEALFRDNCAKCHFICKQGIGPALAGVTKRRKKGWLISFIRNSQQIIGSGDKYANHLFQSYSGVVMPDFTNLKVEEINKILSYIDTRTVDTFKNLADSAYTGQNIQVNADPEKKKIDYYEKPTELAFPKTGKSVKRGKKLFIDNCQTCHELCAEKIGPPLANVTYRRPLPWLIDFITKPRNVMEHGDQYALFLKDQYKLLMPQTFLEQNEILDILAYLRHESGSPGHVSGVNTPKTPYKSDRIVEALPKTYVPTEKAKTNVQSQSKTMKLFGHIALIIVVVATLTIFILFFLKISRNFDK